MRENHVIWYMESVYTEGPMNLQLVVLLHHIIYVAVLTVHTVVQLMISDDYLCRSCREWSTVTGTW